MKAPPTETSNTLDELIAFGCRAYGHCERCGRSAVLDLAGLAAAHGGTARIGELAKRMRCTACGAKGIALSIAGR